MASNGLGALSTIFNDDPTAKCLALGYQDEKEAAFWTLSRYATTRLVWCFMGVYLAGILVAAVLPRFLYKAPPLLAQAQIRKPRRQRTHPLAVFAVLSYMLDIALDICTAADMFRCGRRSGQFTGAAILYFVVTTWLYWLYFFWQHKPTAGAKAKLAICLMPQGACVLTLGTWCVPQAPILQAVRGATRLLHITEAMFEAAPVFLVLWFHMYVVGLREDAAAATFAALQYSNPKALGRHTAAPRLNPTRRMLWLVCLATSYVRVIAGTWVWSKATKRGGGRLLDSKVGIMAMGRHMDPALSDKQATGVAGAILGCLAGTVVAVGVLLGIGYMLYKVGGGRMNHLHPARGASVQWGRVCTVHT